MINQERLDQWMIAYAPALTKAVTDHPEDYCYPPDEVPLVVARMRNAFAAGSYHHKGRAVRATCKHLGLDYTRKAVDAFLKGES